jgi:hypothetical protein
VWYRDYQQPRSQVVLNFIEYTSDAGETLILAVNARRILARFPISETGHAVIRVKVFDFVS